MNNPAIHNYHSFTAERERMHALFAEQKKLVIADVHSLKEEVEPVAAVINVAKMLTRRDHSLGLLGKGLNAGIDFLIKKVILRRAGFITKFLASFLIKNVVSQFAGNKMKEEFPQVSKILKKT